MFKASVGNSEDIDSSDAADEVISQVKADLNGVSPAAGLLCCSINNDLGKIVASINAAFPGIELIGCTSYGENSSVSGFSDESVTFMAFASDTISMKAGLGRDVSKDGEKSARMAVESARAALGEAPKLAIALPESYRTNGAAFTRGLSAFSDGTTVVGGFAADQLRLKETRQFYKNEVLTDSAPILVFGGPVLFSLGRESGWAPLGKEGTITGSVGNVVREIDGEPATKFFDRYLGGSMGGVAEYAEYPLMVRENNEKEYCLRSGMGAYEATGGITFLSEIPEGSKVRLSEGSRDLVIEGTRKSVLKALELYPGKHPAAALLFSCAGRRNVLGTRTKEEIDIVKGCSAPGLPICGFYSYGEIAPARIGGRTLYNNETFVTLFIGAR